MSRKSRRGETYHRWSEQDEANLGSVIDQMEKFREHYDRQKCPSQSFWDAIAGQMMITHGVTVTGRACEQRWRVIRKARAAAEAAAVAATAAAMDAGQAAVTASASLDASTGAGVPALPFTEPTDASAALLRDAARDAAWSRMAIEAILDHLDIHLGR